MTKENYTSEEENVLQESTAQLEGLVKEKLMAILRPELEKAAQAIALGTTDASPADDDDGWEEDEDDPYWLAEAVLDNAKFVISHQFELSDLRNPKVRESVLGSAADFLAGHIMTAWLTLFEEQAEMAATEKAPHGQLNLSEFNGMLQLDLEEALWLTYVDQVTVFGDPCEDGDYSETLLKPDQLVALFALIAADLPAGKKIPDCARLCLETNGIVFHD